MLIFYIKSGHPHNLFIFYIQNEYVLSSRILNFMGYDRSFGAGGGIGFRDSPGPGPTPVEVGKEYELEVTEISRKGDGVAKVHGFVVFVKEGILGQKGKGLLS
jgi:TRAM domain-containing protein